MISIFQKGKISYSNHLLRDESGISTHIRRLLYVYNNVKEITAGVTMRPFSRESWGILLNLPTLMIIEPGKIYRSGEPRNRFHYQQIQKLNIRTMICVKKKRCLVNAEKNARKLGIIFERFSLGPEGNYDLRALNQCVEMALDTRNQPVLIHCGGGRHRAGLVNAVIRIHQGWSAEEAVLEYVLRAHPTPFVENVNFISAYSCNK